MARASWLALSYNLPINPSKTRVYVWRKLKELGAEYLRQGVALLPNTAQNNQRFTLLAQKIRQMGGEASLMEIRFLDPHDETEMKGRFERQTQAECQQLLSDCAAAVVRLKNMGQPLSSQEMDKIKKMVKRYHKVKARDYFRVASDAKEIEEGLEELVDTVRDMASDVGKQLRGLLEG